MHTLLDLHGNIPTFIRGAVRDVNILDEIKPEAGAFYVMERDYIDFQRLFVFTDQQAASSGAATTFSHGYYPKNTRAVEL